MNDVFLALISRCAVKGRAFWCGCSSGGRGCGAHLVLSFCGVFDASTSFGHISSERVCRCSCADSSASLDPATLLRETVVIHIVTRTNTRTTGSRTFFDLPHFQNHQVFLDWRMRLKSWV